MNALLLPGNSSRNGKWIENLKLAIADHFVRVETQHYQHWQSGYDRADIEYEISVAKSRAERLRPYIIIAKSIGTVISVKGVADGKLEPEKLILLGVPINGGVSMDMFSEWISEINMTVIIIQNSNDPIGSFNEVKAAFKGKSKSLKFVELPGNTHDYLDFDAIARLI
jgi:predicted alpha/beta-hydrolase family hydrolase